MKSSGTYVHHVERVPALQRVGAFLFVSTLFCAAPLSTSYAGGATGGQVDQFMSYGAGARSLAMGAAFVGVSDDASATYWNPAGLSQVTRKEITLMQATLFADTKYDFYSLVFPSKKGG